VNWKKLYRIYREERLTVRRRGGRKRALGTRAPMVIPQGPNQRWSLDFVSDALACGRRFRVLCVIDDFSRECLATVVDTSISGVRVARELDQIAELRGYPCMVVSDNGTELTSNAILKWQEERRVEWHYIAPGKPMQNGFVESLQRAAPRRVPERAPLRRLAPCPPIDRGMARRLQPPPPTHEPRRAILTPRESGEQVINRSVPQRTKPCHEQNV
jgi:transposase InsO family protein